MKRINYYSKNSNAATKGGRVAINKNSTAEEVRNAVFAQIKADHPHYKMMAMNEVMSYQKGDRQYSVNFICTTGTWIVRYTAEIKM